MFTLSRLEASPRVTIFLGLREGLILSVIHHHGKGTRVTKRYMCADSGKLPEIMYVVVHMSLTTVNRAVPNSRK